MKATIPSKKHTVTVITAIKKGKYFVSYPAIIISLIVMIPGFAIAALEWIENDQLFWFVLTGLGLGVVYWAVAVTKWRIWAFSSVQNVHQLQTKAIDCGIITAEGSFFRELEYRTKKDKEILIKLNEKFKQKDIFEKPKNLPKITKLYVNKPIIIFHLVLNLFLFYLTCFSIFFKGIELFTVFLFLVLCYFLQDQFRKVLSNKPQIILSKNGIETREHPPYKWSDIKDLKVYTKRSNKSAKFYLEYITPSKFISICLEDIQVDIDKLREALRIYRNK